MMRSINIANKSKRDASVGLDPVASEAKVTYVMADGSERRNVKILRATTELTDVKLSERFDGDYKKLAQAIMDTDLDLDLEEQGRILNKIRRIYLNSKDEVVYHVNLYQIIHNPEGEEITRRDLTKSTSNISTDIPVQWTGKKFPKDEALRSFVFTLKYQLKHINGLTYDFLYAMAKELSDSNSMMLMGGGKNGNEPLILSTGGDSYRGFLEGRIEGDKYCLILHLTNLELKEPENEAV